METLNDILQSHSLQRAETELRRQQVLDAFPDFISADALSLWHTCLYRFATGRPLSYLRQQTIVDALQFYNDHPTLTLEALASLPSETTHAVLSLLRFGPSWQYEDELSLSDRQHIVQFEHVWHPEYQRYAEHVFNHLIQIPLYVLGAEKKKNYRQMALSNRVDLLRKRALHSLTIGFDPIVRNAIAHGSVAFDLAQLTYVDHEEQKALFPSDFGRLFDDLVDTCHSLLVAMLLFICQQQTLVEAVGLRHLPLGVRFMFIDAFTSHTGFEVVGMVESMAAIERKQLNITCRITSRDRHLQMLEALSVCWHALSFGGDAYDRLGVTMDCGASILPYVFVNAERLRQATVNDESLEEAWTGLIEADMLWYTASAVTRKFFTFKGAMTPIGRTSYRRFLKDLEAKGVMLPGAYYEIRYVKNVSVAPLRRVEAHIVLKTGPRLTQALLEKIVRHAVSRLRRSWVRTVNFEKKTGIPGPPHYVWIRLHASDRRVRTLKHTSPNDKNSLAWVEWFSPRGTKGPILVKEPHQVLDGIRIRYNSWPRQASGLPARAVLGGNSGAETGEHE